MCKAACEGSHPASLWGQEGFGREAGCQGGTSVNVTIHPIGQWEREVTSSKTQKGTKSQIKDGNVWKDKLKQHRMRGKKKTTLAV